MFSQINHHSANVLIHHVGALVNELTSQGNTTNVSCSGRWWWPPQCKQPQRPVPLLTTGTHVSNCNTTHECSTHSIQHCSAEVSAIKQPLKNPLLSQLPWCNTTLVCLCACLSVCLCVCVCVCMSEVSHVHFPVWLSNCVRPSLWLHIQFITIHGQPLPLSTSLVYLNPIWTYTEDQSIYCLIHGTNHFSHLTGCVFKGVAWRVWCVCTHVCARMCVHAWKNRTEVIQSIYYCVGTTVKWTVS